MSFPRLQGPCSLVLHGLVMLACTVNVSKSPPPIPTRYEVCKDFMTCTELGFDGLFSWENIMIPLLVPVTFIALFLVPDAMSAGRTRQQRLAYATCALAFAWYYLVVTLLFFNVSETYGYAIAVHSAVHQIAWLAMDDTDLMRYMVGVVHVLGVCVYVSTVAPALPLGPRGSVCSFSAHLAGMCAAQVMGCACVLLRHIFLLPW